MPLPSLSGSSVPNLAPLPLHRDAGRIAYLDPDAARAGLVGAVDLLRHDALRAKLAGVREDDGAVLDNVFVKPGASLSIAQQTPELPCVRETDERARAART
jgi:hypothetical protein